MSVRDHREYLLECRVIRLDRSDWFDRSIPRGIQPRFICQQDGLDEVEQSFVDELSYQVINEQQRLTVIYPITMAAFSLLNLSNLTGKNRSVSLEQMFIDKNILFTENADVPGYFSSNYQISWPTMNDQNILKQRLPSLYSDLLEFVGNNQLTMKMTGDRLVDAASLMKLIMYRNTCLHLFAKPAFVLLACQANSQVIHLKIDEISFDVSFRQPSRTNN